MSAHNSSIAFATSSLCLSSSCSTWSRRRNDVCLVQHRGETHSQHYTNCSQRTCRKSLLMGNIDSDNEQIEIMNRRKFLNTAAMSVATALSLLSLNTEHVNAAQIHSEFSELAAKIPGAGKPDIWYPSYFLGEWTLYRTLYDVQQPPSQTKFKDENHAILSTSGIEKLRSQMGQRYEYKIRFIKFRDHIIEDRLSSIRSELVNGSLNSDTRIETTWNADNPNVLSAMWNNGAKLKEVKVTKRAFEDQPDGRKGAFVASEYARVAELNGEGALVGIGKPPSVYGRRKLMTYVVRFNSTGDDGGDGQNDIKPVGIDRYVVEYLYAPNAVGNNEKPIVILKYRDFLKPR